MTPVAVATTTLVEQLLRVRVKARWGSATPDAGIRHGHGGGGDTRGESDRAAHDGGVVTLGRGGRPVGRVDRAGDGVAVGARSHRDLRRLRIDGGLHDPSRSHVDELVPQIGGPEQVGPAVVVFDESTRSA